MVHKVVAFLIFAYPFIIPLYIYSENNIFKDVLLDSDCKL